MAWRKKSKAPRRRATKKRTYKKRYVRRRRDPALPQNYIGFPKNRVVRMRYVVDKDFSLSTSGFQTFFFRANGIFDPDTALGGHQPYGHDQWLQFYNHYVVIGSKVNMQITTPTTPQTTAVMASILLTDDLTVNTNPVLAIEQGKARYTLIDGSGAVRAKNVRNNFSARKFFNVKDVLDNVDRIGATFGADPLDQAYYALTFSTTNGSVTDVPYQALITIDYLVMLSEPRELPSS